jgi:hypothetical protein
VGLDNAVTDAVDGDEAAQQGAMGRELVEAHRFFVLWQAPHYYDKSLQKIVL